MMTEAEKKDVQRLLKRITKDTLSLLADLFVVIHNKNKRPPIGSRRPGLRGEVLCYLEAMPEADREWAMKSLSCLAA